MKRLTILLALCIAVFGSAWVANGQAVAKLMRGQYNFESIVNIAVLKVAGSKLYHGVAGQDSASATADTLVLSGSGVTTTSTVLITPYDENWIPKVTFLGADSIVVTAIDTANGTGVNPSSYAYLVFP